MNKMKMIGIVLGILVFSGTVVGCNNSKVSSEQGTSDLLYYSITIDGEKNGYSEDDKEIKEIKAFGEEFTLAATTANYLEKYEGKEYTYYIKEVRKMYEDANIVERSDALIQERKLITNVRDLEWKKVEIYTVKGAERSKVVLDYVTTTTSGTDEYLESADIELNTDYKRTIEIELAKEENEWRVQEIINISPREKLNK